MGKGQKGIGDREELMLTVASGGVGGGGVRWGGMGGWSGEVGLLWWC